MNKRRHMLFLMAFLSLCLLTVPVFAKNKEKQRKEDKTTQITIKQEATEQQQQQRNRQKRKKIVFIFPLQFIKIRTSHLQIPIFLRLLYKTHQGTHTPLN